MQIVRLLAFTALVGAVPPGAALAKASQSAPMAQSAGTLILSSPEFAALRQRKGELAGIIKKCTADLDYEASPLAALALDPHYTATGVNKSPNNGKQFVDDSRQAFRMGLCYQLTGDTRYAGTAQRILDGWGGTLKAITNEQSKSTLNFNIQYMIIAASWVRGANNWNSSTFDSFVRSTALPNSSSANANNHGAWGVFFEAAAAAYLGDTALLVRARNRWQEHVAGATNPDGILFREITRSNTSNWNDGPDKGIKGVAYTHYFMLPASLAAKIFADQGQPVWDTPSGKLFGKAFEKAAAFTQRPETFPYYASNNGQLMGVRNAAYFHMLVRYYPNKDAEAAIRQGDLSDGGFLLMERLFGRTQNDK